MIKRSIALILALMLTLACAACGGNGNSPSGDGAPSIGGGAPSASPGNNAAQSDGTSSETGSELTKFSDAFTDALGTTSGRFEPALNRSEISPGRLLELINATMPIAAVAAYDAVGNDLLAEMTGIEDRNGYREVNGTIITFGEDYVREEEGFYGTDQLAGDREVVAGKVDLSANTLTYESYTERGGKRIRRNITEGVLLPDGGVMLQWLDVGTSVSTADPAGKAIFITADAENLFAVKGDFAYDADFTYTSIVGKSALTAEELAAGYTVAWRITSDLEQATSE